MREIGKLDPSLVESWNLSLKAADEAELEVGHCSSTDEEREVLKKQISMIKKGKNRSPIKIHEILILFIDSK